MSQRMFRRQSRAYLNLWLTAFALVALSVLPYAYVTAQEEKLKVVATFSILSDLVHNVGGDKIDLTTLVPANSDTHTFEPSPADSVALADADVIFQIGLEFETWLDDLVKSAASNATVVVVTKGIETIDFAGEHAHEGEATGTPEIPDAEHHERDPHVWHDVKNAILMVQNIRDALIAADEANADTYKANADAYLKQLDELDKFVVDEVAKVPEAGRILVTSHDALGYFGKRYGFRIDTALGVTTDESSPSAGAIAALVEDIKKSGVKVIFLENISNPNLIEQISREAGVAVGPELFTDALGDPGLEGDTYVKLVRYNVTAIVDALSK
jgi:zinc/manganese transport system substrate-binding protein